MKKGFTLIGLLVTVIIVGILLAVALPQYDRAQERHRANEAWKILQKMQTALEEYNAKHNGDWTEFDDSTEKWKLLNLDLPLTDSNHFNKKVCLKEDKNFTYSLESHDYVRAYRGKFDGTVWKTHDYDLFIDLTGKTWRDSKPGWRLCSVAYGAVSSRGRKICASTGEELENERYLVK